MKMDDSKKLDKILYFMGSTDQHFETMNGTIKRHELKLIENEKRFTKVYEDFQKQCKITEKSNDIKFDKVNQIALNNKGNIMKFSWIAFGASIIFSLLVTTKTIGLW